MRTLGLQGSKTLQSSGCQSHLTVVPVPENVDRKATRQSLQNGMLKVRMMALLVTIESKVRWWQQVAEMR